jgi:acyl-CoA thioester hydrolase
MTTVNPAKFTLREHEIEIRVRYQETDAQGIVHHANYLNYFEIGRIEMLRAGNASYKAIEEDGIMLVVSEAKVNFHKPAHYDDLLHLTTTLERARGVRIRHRYRLRRGNEVLVEGYTIVASVSKSGKVVRLPNWLQMRDEAKG